MSSIWYYEPFYDFDRFLDDAINTRLASNDTTVAKRPSPKTSGDLSLRPRMDLHEDNDKNIVTATFELPGLKKEDVNIDVHDNRLSVSGESQLSKDKEEGGYAVRERQYGKFSRTLQLPPGVKEDEIRASMNNGVLNVEFPKSSKQQAHKRIAIN